MMNNTENVDNSINVFINDEILTVTFDQLVENDPIFRAASGAFQLSANLDSDVASKGFIKTFTETDPVYTADKPYIQLKANLDTDVAGFGYIKTYTETDPIFTAASANFQLKANLDADVASKGYIKTFTETDPVYTADKPTIALKSEIPTKVSELQNDSGFITGYTETDPVFAAASGDFQLKADLDTDVASKGYIKTFTETDPVYTADKPTIALKTELNNYLPLSGNKSITGTISFSIDNAMTRGNDANCLAVRGGTTWGNGAFFELYGQNDDIDQGSFRIGAASNNANVILRGTPLGSLTWNNQDIALKNDLRDLTLEDNLTTSTAGTFTGSFSKPVIQRYGTAAATSGSITITYTDTTGVTTNCPTIEVHIPLNGNVSTITLGTGLQGISIPEEIEVLEDYDYTYAVFVIRRLGSVYVINYSYSYGVN